MSDVPHYLEDDDGCPEMDEDNGEDCGRWMNGRLGRQCSKAGSEECDWHCPIGLPHRAALKRKRR